MVKGTKDYRDLMETLRQRDKSLKPKKSIGEGPEDDGDFGPEM